jgi:PAS domain S-box-containing protein
LNLNSKLSSFTSKFASLFGKAEDRVALEKPVVTPGLSDEGQFKTVANAVPQIIWTARPDGFVDWYSDWWYTYLGVPRGTGWDDPGFVPMHPDDVARTNILWPEAIRTGKTFEMEQRFRRASDGMYRWHIVRGVPIHDADGKIIKYVGTNTDIHDQKASIELIDANRRNLEMMISTSPSFMCLLNAADLRFEQVNEKYLQLIGHRNVIGKTVEEALPEVKEQGFVSLLEGVRDTGQPFIGRELPVALQRTPDSPLEQRYADFVYQPAEFKDGRVHKIFAHGVDVTEKVHARTAIENERKNFEELFRQTPQFVAILSGADHRFEFVNEAHVEMLGFNATGKTVREAQPESLEVYALLDQVYQKGETLRFSEIPITLGTRLRYFDVTYAPRRDLAGSIDGIMVLGIEATNRVETRKAIEEGRNQAVQLLAEREKAEAELRLAKDEAERAREELYSFFMQAPTPMVIFTGPEHRFSLANPLYEEYVRRKVVGKTVREVFTEEEVGYYTKLLDNVFQTGEPYVGRELPLLLRNPDGTERSARIDVSYTPFKNSDGEIRGILVFIQDVTEQYKARVQMETHNRELHQAKDEADRANQLKSAFLANMSHEIRTPLGAMIGFADLLREPGLSPAERANYIDILSRNGEGLSVIINDILDLSKVEAGHLTLEFTDAYPAQIAEDVLSLLRVKAKEKDLSLVYKFEESTPQTVVADPTRIRQVLLNIVGNAIKFTQFGSITLRSFGCETDSGKPAVCFEVIDTGIGIPDEQKENVFEMFVQADGSTTRRFGGTGLGLALSRRLAREMGGDIVITKSEPGVGSTFLITIEDQPQKRNTTQDPTADERKKRTDLGQRALEKVRVLVVDDSPDNRQLIWHYLNRHGAIIDAAEDGFMGVRMALGGDYDLVLMDLQMPEMDGYTAIHKLRTAGFKKPIIALTAHAMNEVRDKVLRIGANAHLPKPINASELVGTIADFVGR